MGNCTSSGSSEVQEDNNDIQNNIVIKDETVHYDGCSRLVSIYSQKGYKEINQDAAIFYQGFGIQERSFCGVFDGHGKHGHAVSKLVSDRLSSLILSQQKAFAHDDYEENINNETVSSSEWRRACVSAFKVMDKEIKRQENLDSSWSGTTAVTAIVQGEDLVISNLGDSRAILGTTSDNDELIAIQLTTDLKPDLPNESDRIKKCNGRIFALNNEPNIQRVWLPNDDLPGLAMSRCFGDFGIKNYGIIAIPQMSYHRITNKDQFLVLASDGVWDVLTNNEVASIVWSVKNAEKAAIAVVNAAVAAWIQKYPATKIDDCTVVCLFLQEKKQDKHLNKKETSTSPT
ncbi:hypothetical protein AQUCO_00100159v1 [Aquilegia coerulea]|uniref:PPM-type phosphatase domain-containing protein n=1 Tax=Aquilegia coerulea TaxID=218851 RepID=A0A2G5F914_AQUCA|nr:hypothetical protein AQUCO_00100159v1 [Aquilegia coerulea]